MKTPPPYISRRGVDVIVTTGRNESILLTPWWTIVKSWHDVDSDWNLRSVEPGTHKSCFWLRFRRNRFLQSFTEESGSS